MFLLYRKCLPYYKVSVNDARVIQLSNSRRRTVRPHFFKLEALQDASGNLYPEPVSCKYRKNEISKEFYFITLGWH